MNKVRLPRCVDKYDLATYFDCSYDYLWKTIITDDLLEEWGFSYETHVKPLRTLPPLLTRQIYLYYRITDLDKPFFLEIQEELSCTCGKMAEKAAA